MDRLNLNSKVSGATGFHTPVQGLLAHVQTVSNFPSNFSGVDNSREIQINRSDWFIYASNCGGNDRIIAFEIDRVKGTLSRIRLQSSEEKTSRNFVIDPPSTTPIIANQINVLGLDPNTEKLSPRQSGHQYSGIRLHFFVEAKFDPRERDFCHTVSDVTVNSINVPHLNE